MNKHNIKGFTEEIEKMAIAPLLLGGAALGSAALGYGGYKAYKSYQAKKMKEKQLEARQLHSNRLGKLAPRLDPQLL